MKRTGVIFLLSLALFLPVSLVFSQLPPAQRAPEVDHITVYVRDLQKSSDFYEKVMGLEKIPEPFKDKRHIWFRMGPHEQLEFTTHLDHMQVKYQNFKGDGKVSVRPDGVHQIYLQDPDGYWIEVNDDKF